MNANEARKLSNGNGRQQAIQEKIEMIESDIRRACERGSRETHFGMKEEYGGIKLSINGKYEPCPEVKQYFKRKGYKFKDTGYSWGVYQHTERITW